jgi:ankyrin repeat protein
MYLCIFHCPLRHSFLLPPSLSLCLSLQLTNLLLIRDTFEPYGVDINYSNPSNGETLLMRASSRGYLDIIHLLHECSYHWVINYNLDINKLDFNGMNALMKACQNGHLICVKYLIEVLKADMKMKDYEGWNCLHFAASKGHWAVVEYLVLAR